VLINLGARFAGCMKFISNVRRPFPNFGSPSLTDP